MSGEDISNSNEQNQIPEGWAELIDQEIEQMHDRNPGESDEDYEARLDKMRKVVTEQLESEAEAKAKAEAEAKAITDENGKNTEQYANSEYYEREKAAEERAAQTMNDINQKLANGEISQETAEKMRARTEQLMMKRVESIHDDYRNRRTELDDAEYDDLRWWVDNPEALDNQDAAQHRADIGVGEQNDAEASVEGEANVDLGEDADDGAGGETDENVETGSDEGSDAEADVDKDMNGEANRDTDADAAAEVDADSSAEVDADADAEVDADAAAEVEVDEALEKEVSDAEEAEKSKEDYEDSINDIDAEVEKRRSENLAAIDALDREISGRQAGEAESGLELDLPYDKVKAEVIADKNERMSDLREKLDEMLPYLGEMYAKGRRLIDVAGNRAKFREAAGDYEGLLNQYLQLKSETLYEEGRNEINEKLEQRFEELSQQIEEQLAEFESPDEEGNKKTAEELEEERERLIEEANETLKREYSELTEALETKVSAEFTAALLEEKNNLEDATIKRLDNGTICRKIVSKIINNKILKGALVAAGVVGLAVTGVGLAAGLATGAMTVGFGGFTAAGVIAGAAKGGLAGTVMSRQSSEKSAVRTFADEAAIREGLKDINLSESEDVANVGSWLMGQYEKAKESDLKSNRRRTLIAAGIGAAMGALMSGVEAKAEIEKIGGGDAAGGEALPTVNNAEQTVVDYQAANLGNVNIPEGHGALTTFEQLGGDPANYEQFEHILYDIAGKYQMSPGSNGVVPGYDGTVGNFAFTYPGTIDTWPDTARSMITEAANEAARQGLIPGSAISSNVTGAVSVAPPQPIYNPTVKLADSIIPAQFINFFNQRLGGIAGGVIAGAAVNVRRNRVSGDAFPASVAENSGDEPTVEIVDHGGAISGNERDADADSGETNNESDAAENDAAAEQDDVAAEQSNDGEADAAATATPEQGNVDSDAATPEQGDADPDAGYRENAREALGGVLDERGIDIMTRRLNPNTDNSDIMDWWNGLTAEAKQAVIRFNADSDQDSLAGGAMREWLENHPVQVAEANGV